MTFVIRSIGAGVGVERSWISFVSEALPSPSTSSMRPVIVNAPRFFISSKRAACCARPAISASGTALPTADAGAAAARIPGRRHDQAVGARPRGRDEQEQPEGGGEGCTAQHHPDSVDRGSPAGKAGVRRRSDTPAGGPIEFTVGELSPRYGDDVIERGRILCYRVFDAGDTIALDVAEKKLAARRVEMLGPLVEGLVMPVRPLEVHIGECVLADRRRSTASSTAVCTARIFDFGAISFLYDIAIEPGTTLEELTPLCDALYDAPELDARGKEHRKGLMDRLGDSIEKPHDWSEGETYTITFIEKLSGAGPEDHRTNIAALARSERVAKLLLGETSDTPLSAATRDDVLKNAFSYLVDDLVIVDWNSAFVVEPSGSRIVPFVLELATSQLLEFRYYDGILEGELARVYDHVEKARPRIIRSPYGALMRQVVRRFMELTEFTERVDNAIKSVGDFYLARVYLSAINRFRVPQWRESVESKLGLVSRAYELLKGEVEVSRAQLLEIIIVRAHPHRARRRAARPRLAHRALVSRPAPAAE